MKLTSRLCLAATAAALFAISTPASAAVMLPGQGGDPLNCGVGPGTNCLIFSDFEVFSLAYLQFQDAGSNKPPKSGDAFYVPSSPGSLKDAIVIATGAGGLTNPVGAIDNPYDTPNAVPKNQLANFAMSPNDPLPSFTGDNIHQPLTTVNNNATGVESSPGGVADASLPLWDIAVDALRDYLDGGALDFFFNLNQTNNTKDDSYLKTPQDMLAYMVVYLTSADGKTVIPFRLDGNNCTGTGLPGDGLCLPEQGYAQDADVNDILPTDLDKWAYVHGSLCALADGTVLGFGLCTQDMLDAGGKTVDQNLGANNASFALHSVTLDFWLNNSAFTGGTMSVDLRMAAENNGFEQLFILAGDRIPNVDVPEPLTIGIFGAGLAGLGLLRRRRKSAKA